MSIESRRKQYAAVFRGWQIAEALGKGTGGNCMLFRISRSDDARETGTLKVITLVAERGNYENLTQEGRSEFLATLRESQGRATQEIGRMERARGSGKIARCLDYKFVNWIDETGYGCDMLLRMDALENLPVSPQELLEVPAGLIFSRPEETEKTVKAPVPPQPRYDYPEDYYEEPKRRGNAALIVVCSILVVVILGLIAALLWMVGNTKEPQKEPDRTLQDFGSILFGDEKEETSPQSYFAFPEFDAVEEDPVWMDAPAVTEAPAYEPTQAPTEPPTEPPTEAPAPVLTTASVMKRSVIAAGQRHTAVMKSDGTAIAAGSNAYGQCDVSGWSNLVAIGAGDRHTVGLRADGTLHAAGQNKYGQCSVSSWTDVVILSVGDYHTVGLQSDGTILATGWDTYDQSNATRLMDAAGGREIIALAAGYEHTALLLADGTVAAVGRNDYGQCNVSSWTDIIAIYAGTEHTVGLRSDGTVVATGRNVEGQCNVSGWSDVVCLSAGDYFVAAVTGDGRVLTTGRNEHGELDLFDWTDVAFVGGGCAHTVAITEDGTILAAGWNEDGQCRIANYIYE